MTPRQAAEKYGPKAAGIAAVAFVAAGFAITSPADKLADHEARIAALEASSRRQVTLSEGMARKQCMDDYDGARLAGLPCASLLDGGR